MDPKDFVAPEAGRSVTTTGGYRAFVPAPLPPALQYDPELVRQLSRADAALSEVSGLGRLLPNPHLLIAPWIRREAVLSSRIEGTQTSLSEVLIAEIAGSDAGPNKAANDMREVRNYIAALEHGIARLRELPLSLRLVRELHERLMQGVRGDKATPREFRRSQNWIGPSGSTPVTAPYVPPPVTEMLECLDAWEKFLHVHDAMPELVQCALVHEQFEAIHPFLDGNGRVGRLLITLFLIERGRLSQPLLYLSSYIDAHRNDYYDLLQRVRTHGDWTAWLRYFVTGIAETAADAAQQAIRLLELRDRYRDSLHRSPRAQQLVEALFANPYVTAKHAQQILGTSNPTARSTLAVLEKHGIVREQTGRQWGRLYVADEILAAIESR
ncbi:MAG: Fic family protein [Burkholderiales bacterium]